MFCQISHHAEDLDAVCMFTRHVKAAVCAVIQEKVMHVDFN